MLNKLYPDTYLDSIDDIDFEMYYKKGIRGIVSDIDNTCLLYTSGTIFYK